METSRNNINLTASIYTDIYAASSISLGFRISLQNLSSEPIVVYVGVAPSLIYQAGEVVPPLGFTTVPAGALGCFAKTVSGYAGLVSVQMGGYSIPDSSIDERVYTGLKAVTVQPFTEANVKNGTQYELAYDSASVAQGANLDLIFKTGSKPVLVKSRQISFTGSVIRTEVYKSSVFTGGTSLVMHNLNTDSSLTSLVTCFQQPTINSVGTLVSPAMHHYGTADQGNKASGTYAVPGVERVLAANTNYLLRINNEYTSACKISVYITFYEGELSSLN